MTIKLKSLPEQVVVVTGASSGIGLITARPTRADVGEGAAHGDDAFSAERHDPGHARAPDVRAAAAKQIAGL